MHEGVIAGCEHDEQISKIASTTIAQLSEALDTGERVLSVVSYGECALGHGIADKRTCGFFSTRTSFSPPLSSTILFR
jgi:hypothetical protein